MSDILLPTVDDSQRSYFVGMRMFVNNSKCKVTDISREYIILIPDEDNSSTPQEGPYIVSYYGDVYIKQKGVIQ